MFLLILSCLPLLCCCIRNFSFNADSCSVFFQSVQENEDDSTEISNAAEISELLGDKEHLYPKILYLVIADSAYSEGLSTPLPDPCKYRCLST